DVVPGDRRAAAEIAELEACRTGGRAAPATAAAHLLHGSATVLVGANRLGDEVGDPLRVVGELRARCARDRLLGAGRQVLDPEGVVDLALLIAEARPRAVVGKRDVADRPPLRVVGDGHAALLVGGRRCRFGDGRGRAAPRALLRL